MTTETDYTYRLLDDTDNTSRGDYETLEEAKGAATYDKLTAWTIYHGDMIVASHAPEALGLPPDPENMNDDRAEDEPATYLDDPTNNEWDNVTTFTSRAEAVAFAQEHFGADENGMVCLISGGTGTPETKPPQVVIVIEGGIVREVLSSIPLDAGILDYDTECADETEVFDVVQRRDEQGSEIAQACGHIQAAAVNPTRVAELLEAINSKPDPHEECSEDGCRVRVYPEDPYFATPCGTYCTEHMREHVKECGACKNHFD